MTFHHFIVFTSRTPHASEKSCFWRHGAICIRRRISRSVGSFSLNPLRGFYPFPRDILPYTIATLDYYCPVRITTILSILNTNSALLFPLQRNPTQCYCLRRSEFFAVTLRFEGAEAGSEMLVCRSCRTLKGHCPKRESKGEKVEISKFHQSDLPANDRTFEVLNGGDWGPSKFVACPRESDYKRYLPPLLADALILDLWYEILASIPLVCPQEICKFSVR